ncbi:MAG: hypothetical protein GWO22_18365, partial [Actinobacteria bacterium]|nr:hypothetical protein [Actinomycetota bacterium]
MGAYVLGQLAYAAGSRLDPGYDRWRRRSIKSDPWLKRAKDIAEAEGVPPSPDVNTYKYAEARLRIESPSGIAAVDRAQAES